MKTQKTVRINDPDSYGRSGIWRLSADGHYVEGLYETDKLIVEEPDPYSPGRNPEWEWPRYESAWGKSEYAIGAKCMLASDEKDRFYLVFGRPNGLPGNSNRNICRFHGWRGTTDNESVYAHGLREIIGLRKLRSGAIAVTVGPDLTPNDE